MGLMNLMGFWGGGCAIELVYNRKLQANENMAIAAIFFNGKSRDVMAVSFLIYKIRMGAKIFAPILALNCCYLFFVNLISSK